jgi:predicted CopG family antitoxin
MKNKYKTVGIHDGTYRRLFLLQVKMQEEKKRRVTFSEVIDKLLESNDRPVLQGKKIVDNDFNEMETFLDEQKKLHNGDLLACAKVDGKWIVLAHGKTELELWYSIEDATTVKVPEGTNIVFR